MQDIKVVTRALIEYEGSFLLARAKGNLNMFLPGGHIEKGEFAREALKRELMEELGANAEIKEYAGTLEYIYRRDERTKVQEVNLIFQVDLEKGLIESKESKIEFIYVKPEKFESVMLLPEPLPHLIRKWLGDRKPFYESMVESREINEALKAHQPHDA
jgi:8-oxo-dGTP pyrophosphatase MutT (NUDIX family)